MKFVTLFLTIMILSFTSECTAYRILGVFPLHAKSHNIVFEALMKGLAKRGHQVDVVTHFPLKKPFKNYHDIINLNGTMENIMNNFTFEFVSALREDVVTITATRFGNRLCHLMGLESMQKLIKNPPKDKPYDLVITEAFGTSCYFGLGYIFKVPVIGISSAVEYPWLSHFIGNDDNLAYVPNTFYTSIGQLSYWDRVKNVLVYSWKLHRFHDLTAQSQTESMRKYLHPDIPDVREVEKNVALTFVNSNPILFGVKPLTPTLVQIAGIHVEENDETLEPELQKWMDESKDGVVFFTFGSMVLIETLPVKQLKELYASFAKIAPVKVLMKVVDKSKLPPGLPNNVKVLPWIPQIPILAHPNTRLFITHGGLGGLIEAMYHGVPMIGIPLFGDQFHNCDIYVAKKLMVPIDFKNFSGEVLDSALEAVLHDPFHKNNAIHFSKLFRDKPMRTMDAVAFWVEYIIRNGQVLRPPALDYTWWQLAMLDVYGLFLLVFIFSIIVIIFVIRLIFEAIFKVFHKKFRNVSKIKSKTQ